MARPGRVVLIGGILLIVAAASAVMGISNRAKGVQEMTQWSHEQAIPTVNVIKPQRRGPGKINWSLPGTVNAFYTAAFTRAPAAT